MRIISRIGRRRDICNGGKNIVSTIITQSAEKNEEENLFVRILDWDASPKYSIAFISFFKSEDFTCTVLSLLGPILCTFSYLPVRIFYPSRPPRAKVPVESREEVLLYFVLNIMLCSRRLDRQWTHDSSSFSRTTGNRQKRQIESSCFNFSSTKIHHNFFWRSLVK